MNAARSTLRDEEGRRGEGNGGDAIRACLLRTGQNWSVLVRGPANFTQEQLIREAIRRYNGGREYMWQLNNPNENQNCANGSWVEMPHPQNPNYVNSVLDCTN